MQASWLVHTARGRDRDRDRELMGSNILYRTVHTAPRPGMGPDPLSPIVLVPFPIPIPVPVPCSVNAPSVGKMNELEIVFTGLWIPVNEHGWMCNVSSNGRGHI